MIILRHFLCCHMKFGKVLAYMMLSSEVFKDLLKAIVT